MPTQAEVLGMFLFLGASVGKRMGTQRELEAESGKRYNHQMAVAYSSGDRKGLGPQGRILSTGSSQGEGS